MNPGEKATTDGTVYGGAGDDIIRGTNGSYSYSSKGNATGNEDSNDDDNTNDGYVHVKVSDAARTEDNTMMRYNITLSKALNNPHSKPRIAA